MHCTEPDSGSVPTLNYKSHNLSVDDEVDRQANLLLHEASSPVRHVVSPLTAAYPDLRLKLPAVVYHSSRDLNSVQLYPSLNRINTALCNFHHSTGNLTHLVPIDLGLITRGGGSTDVTSAARAPIRRLTLQTSPVRKCAYLCVLET